MLIEVSVIQSYHTIPRELAFNLNDEDGNKGKPSKLILEQFIKLALF